MRKRDKKQDHSSHLSPYGERREGDSKKVKHLYDMYRIKCVNAFSISTDDLDLFKQLICFQNPI